MQVDARKLPTGTTLETDVCIVGAGAAGITLALELAGDRARVCLLESGGIRFDGRIQALYAGENVGRGYQPVDACRLRYFGGSTNHWMGSCSELDACDFQVRDWLPYSGWPFAREHLDPYYARADRYLGIDPRGFEAAAWERAGGFPPFHAGLERLRPKIYQYKPVRFGEVYRAAVTGARNVSLYTHATALELETDENAASVRRIRAGSLDGSRFHVRSRLYVLAAGGIENPRLLLLSRSRAPAGLGNGHDLVGRFFMEHLDLRTGVFAPPPGSAPGSPLYFRRDRARVDGTEIRACVGFPDEVLLKQQLLNASFVFEPLERPDAAPAATLHATSEQAPNPESRVTLREDRDAFGQPRVNVDWRPGPADKRSLLRAHRVLAAELGRLGIGRVRVDLPPGPDTWPDDLRGDCHHMGTTRMHPDPRLGVVDASSRVHGVANLFVAGCSVFPTAGFAPPTRTLVALAVRLGDHLKHLLGERA